jgi:hypothetical protein
MSINLSEESSTSRHVLRTSAGVLIEGTLDPVTLQWTCCWSPPPPYPRKKMKRIAREYFAWRNAILADAARRKGIRLQVFTPDADGAVIMHVLGDDKEAQK